MCAASLAHHRLLDSVDRLYLRDDDLSPIPTEHLTSLVSCVTNLLLIQNVSGCDLVSIMTSVKCEKLSINRRCLGKEETQALVQVMESRVEMVTLSSEVTLDIEALTEYSGQGVCKYVNFWGDTADRYREEMRTWARSRNWRIAYDEVSFVMFRQVPRPTESSSD